MAWLERTVPVPPKGYVWPLGISAPGGRSHRRPPYWLWVFAGGKPVKDCIIDICETKSQCWLTEFILPD